MTITVNEKTRSVDAYGIIDPRDRTEEEWDALFVEYCSRRIRDKMAVNRDKGRKGWHDSYVCSPSDLRELLMQHVKRSHHSPGQLVDVGIIALMLDFRLDAGGDEAANAREARSTWWKIGHGLR